MKKYKSRKMKDNKNVADVIKISSSEKELLREMVRSERANIKVFNLSDKKEQVRYEKTLERLDTKLA